MQYFLDDKKIWNKIKFNKNDLIVDKFFLLCTLHRASSKMKKAQWGFNFKKS
jgi:hypothetical protein